METKTLLISVVITVGLSFSAAGCGDSGITACSPFGTRICDDNKLFECRGPNDTGGDEDGEGVLVDDCEAAGEICNYVSAASSCMTLEAFCAQNVTPTPPECQ